jgi:hypothetical protein
MPAIGGAMAAGRGAIVAGPRGITGMVGITGAIGGEAT